MASARTTQDDRDVQGSAAQTWHRDLVKADASRSGQVPRLTWIVSGATGALVLLTCIVVQVLSRQPASSAFRIVWDVLGLLGSVLLVASVWLLKRRTR